MNTNLDKNTNILPNNLKQNKINPPSQNTHIEINKLKNKKVESLELALPEISIDKSHRIENFYPYFFKNNLLELNPHLAPNINLQQQIQLNQPLQLNQNINPLNVMIDNKNFRSNPNIPNKPNCLDSECEICDLNNRISCLQCLPGHFMHEGKCYNACPNGFMADIYKRECMSIALRTKNTFSRVTYLKAFSTGSCKNMCGKVSIDCSCQTDCTQYGNCCSDYRDCEILTRQNTIEKQAECQTRNNICELCSDLDTPNSPKCGQCKAGYYLTNFNECVKTCDVSLGDTILKESMVCYKSNQAKNTDNIIIPSQRCLVESCLECEFGNPSVCKQCLNGFFLSNNMCYLFCPGTLRADRMNWVCMEPNVFSWYWVFPSKSSCRNRCDIAVGPNVDCSCREDCIRYGNCCQDVEDYCYKFIIG